MHHTMQTPRTNLTFDKKKKKIGQIVSFDPSAEHKVKLSSIKKIVTYGVNSCADHCLSTWNNLE